MARALVALAVSTTLVSTAAAEPFKLKIDQTVTLRLSQPADSVAVGNATVADVVVHDPTTLLVTGKMFGTTNILVLDRDGRTVYASELAVYEGSSDQLTIVRGSGSYTYSCIDKCRPTPAAGDAPEHFGEVMSAAATKAGAAKGQ